MPPVNIDFAHAIDLGTLPADVTQTDIHDSGTGLNYTVYYKFTAPANAEMIGAWGFATIADPYRPVIRPYDASFNQILGIGANNVPIQFPVTAGQVYYLEFSKTNNLTPANLRVRAEVGPLNEVARGNILVNDDTLGFPLAVLDHTTDYNVITFKKDMAAGESGDVLDSGIICLEDRDTLQAKFYDLNFLQFAAGPVQLTNFAIRAQRQVSKFYVGNADSPSVVRVYDALGVLQATHNLTTNQIFSLAANSAETILYYANSGVGQQIRRWDLVNHVALSDLTVGDAGISINDILFMADGTIISVHENLAGTAVECRNYNAAGTLLHTYTCPNNFGSFSKLAYANDTATFWNWTHDNTGRSRFQNIRVADGVVVTDRLMQEYEGGAMNAGETATPLSRYGNSFSCPFFIYPVDPLSGIFFVDPTKSPRHDSYYGSQEKKIPNPTVRTAYVGN